MSVTEAEQEKIVNQAQMDAIMEGNRAYLCSYRVNISGDECVCGTSKEPEALVATNGISATELFEIISENVPGEAERSMYTKCIDRDNLLKEFGSGQKSVSVNHNYVLCGKQMLITTTVNMYQNPLNGDIECLMYMFDTSVQYIENKIQSLLIGRKFESVAVIDLKTQMMSLMSQFLYIPEGMSNATQQEVEYTPHIKRVAEAYVVPEEVDRYIHAASLEVIQKSLDENGAYFFTVASVGVHKQKCYQKFTYYYLDEKKELIVSVMEDVTEEAHRDLLTGMFNRRGFVREAERYIKDSSLGMDLAVVFFNVRDFQTVDELYGMDGGDLMLRELAARLKESFLKPLLMARSEADHFVCLVDWKKIDYDKLTDMLDIRYRLNGRDIELRSSCGIYRIEDVTVDINKMCDRAKLAEHSIVNRQEKPYAVYEPSME